MTKKILVTGATGLIGKEVLIPLLDRGFTVYAVKLPQEKPAALPGVVWLDCDLFSDADIARVCESATAEYLLNLAWCTTNDYQTSNMNFDFLTAGLQLLKHFQRCGGRRVISAGTCFEYAFSSAPLREDSPLSPETPYEHCKNHLRELAAIFSAGNKLEFGWGRIFFVYGRGENSKRLGGRLVSNLRAGEPVFIPPVTLSRDYIYSKDIAGAFAAFCDCAVTGTVNICTGHAVSLREFAETYARELHREDLLKVDPLMDVSRQPPLIVGDNRRLREEVGYQIVYSAPEAVREIIAYQD